MAKAAFARDLASLLPNTKLTVRNLDQLLKMKGPAAGAHNIVFYAAYVFFEKLRIREGKKKSVKREKMEELYDGKADKLGRRKSPGFPREGSHNMRLFLAPGERAVLDQYGKGHIKGAPTGAPGIRRGKLSKQ